jgi:hypothetical protein
MTITHNFRSGNSCDIEIPDRITPGEFNDVHVEWDTYPPSAADLREYEHEVSPTRVLPRLEAAMRKTYGPGHLVEIMPGLRGWVPTTSQQGEHN